MPIDFSISLVLGAALVCGTFAWWLYTRKRQADAQQAQDQSDYLALQVDIIEYFSRSSYQDDSQEDILWDIAEHCIGQLGFEDCVIYLLNDERQVWEQKAAYGPKKLNYREIHQPIFIPLNQGIVGAVGASGRSEIISDTRLDGRYILDDDMRLSEMAVPIIADGRVIGVIDSEHPETNFYQPHHLRIVENIAAVCAHKIARTLSEREVVNFANFFLRNPNPVFRVNRQHIVILANRASLDRLPDLVALDQPVQHAELIATIDRVFADQGPAVIALPIGERVFQLNAVLTHSSESVNLYGADVTDLEKARALAQEAERAKANFLSVMSHEIRTPLNAIIGLNALLLDTHINPVERTRYLTEMGAAGRHLLTLINNILDLERLNAGRLEIHRTAFDAPGTFRELISIFNQQARESGNALSLSLPDDLPRWLSGDRNSLMQMLTNLVGNAIKFTQDGRIDLVVSADGEPDFWRIAVRDSGRGIAPEDLERIFVPFEQIDQREKNTGRRGSGLGLTITKQLAELHGGALLVESVAGEGSCFTLRLLMPDAAAPTASKIEALEIEADKNAPQRRVLLVDDNAVNVLVAQRMIEKWNYRVFTAEDGQQAIEAWQQHHPDIILMDVHMPVMDGLEATQQILGSETHDKQRHVPIIALTADAQPEIREQAFQAGMVDVLTKPFDQHVLRETLNKWCNDTSA